MKVDVDNVSTITHCYNHILQQCSENFKSCFLSSSMIAFISVWLPSYYPSGIGQKIFPTQSKEFLTLITNATFHSAEPRKKLVHFCSLYSPGTSQTHPLAFISFPISLIKQESDLISIDLRCEGEIVQFFHLQKKQRERMMFNHTGLADNKAFDS